MKKSQKKKRASRNYTVPSRRPLTDEQRADIWIGYHKLKKTQSQLARAYRRSQQCISLVLKRYAEA